MVARLALATEGLFLFGALLMAASHRARPLPRSRVRADWIKFAVYLAIVHVLLLSAKLGRGCTVILFAGIWLGALLELDAHRAALPRALRAAPAIPAIGLGFALAHALLPRGQTWFGTFALLVLLVASTDSFAQLVGRLWGARRPFPRLSPGKTIEGLAGGWLAAMAVSLTCGFLAPGLSAPSRALVGISTALAATGGDLLFSALKRRAHVKDFSGILPGHGGILDRFDSMVLAAPVYYWIRALTHG